MQSRIDVAVSGLKILTLGRVQLARDSQAVENLASRKAEALLIYLACNPRPHSRETLATLLWDDRTTRRALANLSVLLTSLRKELDDYLDISRQTLAIRPEADIWLDAAAFEQQTTAVSPTTPLTRTSAAQLAQAVALYQGDFLEGYFLRDASGFEEWALLERERLQMLALDALQRLADFYTARGRYEEGIPHALQLTRLDPLREVGHRQLMRLLALSGQRTTALLQYESCVEVLEEELGVAPSEATNALYTQILEGKLTAEEISAMTAAVLPPGPRHNLPADANPFVGREGELAQVGAYLADPDCRLLTLTGPGGVGKTRLALEAARAHVGDFLHGVWLVSLVGLQEADFLATAIADALAFTFNGDDSPQAELLNYLRDKEMLLLLDNFEHLLAHDAPSGTQPTALLSQIAASAPDVKLLATSRERLNVQAEWLLIVDGLPAPPADAPAPQTYGALQLFLQRARQSAPAQAAALAEDPEQLATAADICRLVGGMPLAIELAAAWLGTFALPEIHAEIASNAHFLEAHTRDVPARHRSLRAVFDYSWSLLDAKEQAAFRQLSVFRGGFSLQAAQAVAGASPLVIRRLVDKSLLRRTRADTAATRYEIHELLREFGAHRLGEMPGLQASVAERHARHFADFLSERETKQYGAEQVQALNEIAREIDNIRAAWQWALSTHHAPLFTEGVWGLLMFFDVRGRYAEGLALMRQTYHALQPEDGVAPARERQVLLGRVLAIGSWYHMKLGNLERARELAEQALTILQPLADHEGVGYALLFRGAICYASGDFATAVDNFEAAAEAYVAGNYLFGIAGAVGNLTEMYILTGDLVAAREQGARSVALAEQMDNPYMIAHNVERMGQIAMLEGDLTAAERAFQRSLAVARALEEDYIIANVLESLGRVAHRQGDDAAAAAYFAEGLALVRRLNNPLEIGTLLVHLAEANWRLSKSEAAWEDLREAARTAQAVDATTTLLSALLLAARMDAVNGAWETAVTQAQFVHDHAAATQETRDSAAQLLARASGHLTEGALATAVARGQQAQLQSLVSVLIGDGQEPI